MPRRKLTFGKPGGSAKRGEMVSASGVAYVAKRDTDSSPPGEHWQPAIVRSEAFSGLNGRDGADGRDGKPGKDAPPPTEPSTLDLRGEWRPFRIYERYAVVTHDGSSYVCKVESTRKEPPNADWQLLAAAGARGARGERGEHGIGQRGRPGPAGDSAAGLMLDMVAQENVHAGMVVRVTQEDNYFVRASALGQYPASDIIGLAATAATGGHKCKVARNVLTLQDWSNVLDDGCGKLIAGSYYYLSKILGKLGQSPKTGVMVCMGLAISDTTLLVEIDAIVQWDKPVVAALDTAASKGMFVRPSENGHVDLAWPDYPYPRYAVIGYLTDDFGAGEEASVEIGGGCLTLPDWSAVTEDGSSTLVEDDEYWLSMSIPGKITNVKPDGVWDIGKAKSATKLDVKVGKTKFTIGSSKDCCE